MRPIHLTVSGLHSFRAKQSIDFQTLCEGGVFGIFGPTGSGKSSLLDAMTLALFGKVERASNNTQGILNQAEQELSVSFTFELGRGGGTERYRVERSYKRSGDITVRTAACRLVQIHLDTNEMTVLADKANEIQDRLQELIGLTIDDFTRAVVLPQGKFAEFLSLKGVERRQMLQRLFHLEKYGDQLNERIRLRVAALDSRVKEIAAEQQGLGDASREALLHLEQALSTIDQQLAEIAEQRKLFLVGFEEAKRWREWQEQLMQVEKTLSELLQEQQEMAVLESRLTKAQEAQHIKPYADDLKEKEAEQEHWSKQRAKAEEERKHALALEAKYELIYQQCRRDKEVSQPVLLEEQQRLKQALEIQLELGELNKEKQKRKEGLLQIQQQEQELQAELTAEKSRLHRAKEKQQHIQEQLAQGKVEFTQKEELQLAYQGFLQLAPLEEQLKQAQLEWVEQEQAFASSQREEAGMKLEQQQYVALVQTLLGQAGPVTKHQEQILHDLEQELKSVQVEMKESQSKLEHVRELEWIQRLVDELQDGCPCPVCGATEHPEPRTYSSLDQELLKQQMEEQAHWVEAANKLLHDQRYQLHQLKELEYQLAEWFEAELTSLVNIEKEQSKLEDVLKEEQTGRLKHPDVSFAAQEQVAAALSEVSTLKRVDSLRLMEEWQAEQDAFISKLRNFLQEAKQKSAAWQKGEYQIQMARQNEQAVRTRVEKAKRAVDQFVQEWSSTHQGYKLEQISVEYQKMRQQEKEIYELEQRLEKSFPFIEETEKRVKVLEEKDRDLQLLIREKMLSLQQLEGQLEQNKAKVLALAGSMASSIAEHLREIEARLDQLVQQEQQSYERWQNERKVLIQAERDLAVANESFQQAQARREQAEQRLAQLLEESSFATSMEVVQAYADQDELLGWKQVLEEYQAKLQTLQHEQSKLKEKLGSKRVTEEEWQHWKEQKQELEQSSDRLKEERGAAQNEWNAMQAKVERYTRLEQEKEAVQQELERYRQLQAVFRGNTFVEYLAEEQLIHVCHDASQRLGQLTKQRYALEVDSQGGFVIRDDANGGVRRPVSTLSGGETFLTSLSLALALSAQIQLRGQYPLEFFFLDEGFGTLDPDLLDSVISSLENLHLQHLAVGVISHVPELRERLPKRLIVTPAEASGEGSRVHIETL